MISLNIRIRKGPPDKLRRDGWIPAVVYGPKIKNQALQIEGSIFDKAFIETGESTLIDLKIKDSKVKEQRVSALVHDIQKDPVTDKIIHIDFYAPRLDKAMRVAVPLIFLGRSAAVDDSSGTLVKNIQELEIEVLPKNLPHEIRVDISSLKTFEDRICIKDLSLPPGVKILAGTGEVIALVMPPRSEEELAALEEAPEEKVEEIEKVGEEETESASEQIVESKELEKGGK